MMYQIQSDFLTVSAVTRGAELQSIRHRDGTEYLWQGDPAYWSDRAPNIFPYVARLTKGQYLLDGQTYFLPIHGFAPTAEFSVSHQDRHTICFSLESTPERLAVYPFRFRFSITYTLEDTQLHVTMTVENHDTRTMYFGLGGHPGIRVPLDTGMDFSDYVLDFPETYSPIQVEFTEDCFPTGRMLPFPLRGHQLQLHHQLFDHDAIVLAGHPDHVTLRHPGGGHGVTLHTGALPYLGLWHRPRTDAPYICLEPWSSLPSRKNVVEDLAKQPDLISLAAGDTFSTTWSLTCF